MNVSTIDFSVGSFSNHFSICVFLEVCVSVTFTIDANICRQANNRKVNFETINMVSQIWFCLEIFFLSLLEGPESTFSNIS